MTWTLFGRRPAAPAVPEYAPPTANAALAGVTRTALADLINRKHDTIRLIDGLLAIERAGRGDRRYMDALLDIRNTLDPGSRILPQRNPERAS